MTTTTSLKHLIQSSVRKGLRPYNFQLEGIAFLHKTRGRALIADQMGLGKTIQAALWCMLNPDKRPVLIICPSHLKYNWEDEFKKWFYSSAYTMQIIKTSKDTLDKSADFVVCSYGVLPQQEALEPRAKIKLSPVGKQILDRQFSVVIMDEGHLISDQKTKRTKAIKKLCKTIRHLIVLTGTPMRNRPVDMFNMLNILDPTEFGNWYWYVNRYCGAKIRYGRLDVKGASNLTELHHKIKHLAIRRTKTDVMPELPPKQYSYSKVDVSPIYNLKQQDNDITRWVKMRKSIGIAKIGEANKFVRTFFENNPDEKLVIFAHHHDVIDAIKMSVLTQGIKVESIDGRTTEKNHKTIRDKFQGTDKIQALIIGIQGATGYNLHAAHFALFVEFLYVPAELEQAEDRLHRIGQEYPVNIYYLVAKDTIDEYMVRMLQMKTTNIEKVVDGNTTQDSVVREFLRQVLEGL